MPHQDPTIILKAWNLHKAFSYPAINVLKGVDVIVKRGQAVAITGRSGEGKSTLLQILGTLEDPSRGTLTIANQMVTRSNKSIIRNKHLAFIFQSFHLLEDYTTLENVLMPARIGRQNTSKGSKAYRNAMELLECVGLTDRAHFHTKLLSGGEKQRVAIARALCNNPDIILADEPSGNLDRETAHHIHSLLLDFAKQGKSLIIVTHDEELAALCHKKYVLHHGHLHESL